MRTLQSIVGRVRHKVPLRRSKTNLNTYCLICGHLEFYVASTVCGHCGNRVVQWFDYDDLQKLERHYGVRG